jgi:hypothetical protein
MGDGDHMENPLPASFSLALSFPAQRSCDRESSTAEDSQNLRRYRRTGSPGRGFASPEDDRVWRTKP